MFGSFMPRMGSRGKASAMFGNRNQGYQEPAGQGRQPNNFGSMISNFAQNQQMPQQNPQMDPGMGMRALMPSPQNFMGMLGSMGQMGQMGSMGMQRPQGMVPGDLSGSPGRIGDMYRSGQIKTLGGPSFGMM